MRKFTYELFCDRTYSLTTVNYPPEAI